MVDRVLINLPAVGDLKEGFQVFTILPSVSVPSLAGGLPQEYGIILSRIWNIR